MDETRSLVTFLCIAGYFAVCIGVGVWALRRTTSTRDFFMAGRDLGILVTGLAIFSSQMSGFGFVGGPGLVYRMGLSSSWMTVIAPLAFSCSFYLLATRLRMVAELRDTISLPDAVAARYGSEQARLLTAIAILLGVVGYLGTQILAMATVLRDVLNNVSFVPEVSLAACMAIACAVLVFYCVTGGILASVYTDLVQGGIMIVAAVFVFVAALNAVDGGLSGLVTTLIADDPEAIAPWGTLGMLGSLSWFLVFVLGSAGQPHVITKFMMNRRVEDARRTLPVSAAGYVLCSLLWLGIGLSMRALVVQGGHPELANPDEAAPQFLQFHAGPLLAGIVFAGLFAAIMSTADSFLNLGAAAVVHDIPRALTGRSLSNELFWRARGDGRAGGRIGCLRALVAAGSRGVARRLRMGDVRRRPGAGGRHRVQLETRHGGGRQRGHREQSPGELRDRVVRGGAPLRHQRRIRRAAAVDDAVLRHLAGVAAAADRPRHRGGHGPVARKSRMISHPRRLNRHHPFRVLH